MCARRTRPATLLCAQAFTFPTSRTASCRDWHGDLGEHHARLRAPLALDVGHVFASNASWGTLWARGTGTDRVDTVRARWGGSTNSPLPARLTGKPPMCVAVWRSGEVFTRQRSLFPSLRELTDTCVSPHVPLPEVELPLPEVELRSRRRRCRHARPLKASSRAEMALGRVRPKPPSNAVAARTSWICGCRRRAFHVVWRAFHSVLEVGSRGSTRRGGVIPGSSALVWWSRIPSNRNSLRQTRSDHMDSLRASNDSYVVRLSTIH